LKALDRLPIGPKARRDRLVELVEQAKPRDIPALVLACETFVRNSPVLAVPLVDALAERDADERIAALGSRLHEHPPPITSKTLERAVARLVQVHAGVRPEPARPAVIAAPNPSQLLAEIAAHPDDDGPREVYADVLTQRGDVRGELITLQLARRRGKPTAAAKQREKELLANHKAALLGPFAHAAKRTGLKFDRGFLVEAVASAAWPVAPENALLERLNLDFRALPLDVELSSLVEIENYQPPIAGLLARAPRLRAVRYRYTCEPGELEPLVRDAPRSVEDITITTWGAQGALNTFLALCRSSLAREAKRLEITASWSNETTIAMLLPLLPGSCTTFVFDIVSHVEMRFELARAGDRWALAAVIGKTAQLPRLESELARAIAGLPPLAEATFVARLATTRAAITRAVASIPGAIVR
jgi:uncharacterized protein (TIGR02996 family)